MIICCCKNINESTLKKLIKCNKVNSIKDFRKLNDCSGCGKCYQYAQQVIKNEQNIYQTS